MQSALLERWLPIMVPLGLALVTGCAGGGGGNGCVAEGGACAGDGDCCAKLVCGNDDVCVQQTPDECVAKGGTCAGNDDCCTGLACGEGDVCVESGDDGGAGAVLGQVVDVEANPIAGVAVTLSNGRSASTDENGFFSFSNLPAGDRVVARFRKSGFAATAKGLTAAENGSATLNRVVMMEAVETVTIDADTSSTQRSGDSAVTIVGGSLVDGDGNPVTGEVELTATFIDPSTEAVQAFPGSFEDAQNASGETVMLESFGFAVYEVTQGGEEVNLGDGSTAQIEYVLPDNAQDDYQVGETIPLWEFDEGTATWAEAGEGEVREASDGSGRLAWFAEVDHFSAWNADVPIDDRQCIAGRVMLGVEPLDNVEITAVGVSYNGTSEATTGPDGRFCVDVKRGSTVRIEVRLNDSAQPTATKTVTVPDSPASCAEAECVNIGDIEITLDACVRGRVTATGLPDADIPAMGIQVFVVPGGPVFTDRNGEYCAPVPANTTIYVFAEGYSSTKAAVTGEGGACGSGPCTRVDLTVPLPEPGDVVGNASGLIGGVYVEQPSTNQRALPLMETLSITATFYAFEAEAFSSEAFDVQTETIGECTVTTITGTGQVPTDSQNDFSSNVGVLDSGSPATVGNGAVSVELAPGDPLEFDPPQPLFAGLFEPELTSDELLDLGFSAGQTLTFSFPSGADIGAFSGSVELPPDLNVTSPDLADSEFTVDPTTELDLSWTPGDPSSTIMVYVSGSAIGFGAFGEFTSVSIACEFPDTGAGTVPASLMSRLPADATGYSVTVMRMNFTEVEVPLNRAGGSGIVQLSGMVSLTRSITSIDAIDDLGLCDSNDDCAAGQECNTLFGVGFCAAPDSLKGFCESDVDCPEGEFCDMQFGFGVCLPD